MFNLSIVVTTYKRPKKLTKCLDSIIKFVDNNCEVIVINDDPKEDLNHVKNKYFERVKFIDNKKNIGANASRNKGLINANSNWITFLDDDDEYINCRKNLIKNLNQKYDLYYFNALVFIENYNISYKTKLNFKPKREKFIEGNYLGGTPRFIFSRDFLLKNKIQFSESLSRYQDMDFLQKIFLKNKLPLIKFDNRIYVKCNYSLNHLGISTSVNSKFPYLKTLLKNFSKSELRENYKKLNIGFLKSQIFQSILKNDKKKYFKLSISLFLLLEWKYIMSFLILFISPKLFFKIKSYTSK